ncbi:MAG: hypothetical protein QOG84_1783 [Sphingomonadales bacterium]|jgi:hypothetical protein|nr:hypothetical protein [Sphingomonadales bacterium]
MVAGRHNLTRRALLGASAALPVAFAAPGAPGPNDPFGLSLSKPPTSLLPRERNALRQAQGERGGGDEPAALGRRWARTLAAYRRAQARVAAYKAQEARLPAERRAFPCDDLEAAFARVDSLRFAALRRLLRLPAPDLAALALKLDLILADQAWELTGCETCLEAIAADARRLSANSSAMAAA